MSENLKMECGLFILKCSDISPSCQALRTGTYRSGTFYSKVVKAALHRGKLTMSTVGYDVENMH